MLELLDFLEKLSEKYTEKYIYNMEFDGELLQNIISKEDKKMLYQIMKANKIKLRYMGLLINMNVKYNYWECFKEYDEYEEKKGMHLAMAMDILELMINANTDPERYNKIRNEYLEEGMVKDEYTMNDEYYEKYSTAQFKLDQKTEEKIFNLEQNSNHI